MPPCWLKEIAVPLSRLDGVDRVGDGDPKVRTDPASALSGYELGGALASFDDSRRSARPPTSLISPRQRHTSHVLPVPQSLLEAELHRRQQRQTRTSYGRGEPGGEEEEEEDEDDELGGDDPDFAEPRSRTRSSDAASTLPALGSAVHLTTSPPSVVVWRLLAGRRILHLRRIVLLDAMQPPSLDAPQQSRTSAASSDIQFMLPAPALSPPCILEDADTADLTVLFVTTSGILFRMNFSAPDYFDGFEAFVASSSAQRAMFGTADSAAPMPLEETTYLQCFHIATVAKASRTDAGMRPLIAHFPDMDTACIACANGRIVQVDIPSVERWHQGGYHSENELEETSYLKQIQSYVNTPMKMLFGSSNPPATPGRRDISYRTTRILSMDSIITNAVAVFLFALCDDDKIRVFNCDTRQHLKTIDLSVAVADPAASFTSMRGISSVVSGIGGLAVSHRRMSSLPNPENLRFEQNRVKIFGRAQTGFHGEMTSFYSSVYRPPSSDDVDAGEFLIYKGVVDASGRLSKQEFVFKKIGPAPSLIRTPGGRTVDELNLVDYCIMRKPSPESTPGTVSDSTLDAFQIWTLWSDGNGRGFVLHSGFSIKGESSGANGSPPPTPVFERWEDVAPRDPPAPFPPRVDVDFEDLDGPLNQLLQHLFESDRLSLSAIYQGLDSYAAAAGCSIAFNDAKSRLQVPANPLPTHYNALFDLARFTLKSQIETTIATSDTSSTNTILPPDAATIRQLRETVTKVEWMAFFSLCEQLDAAEHVPTGLCVNPHNRMLLVVQREAVAVVAASTISEVLFGTWTGTFSAAPMLLMSTAQMREAGANARLSDQAFRASLRGFFAVLDSLLGPAGRKGAADADGQIGNQSTEVSAGDAVAGVLGGGMWRAIMEDVIRKRIVDGEETAMDGLDLVRSVKEAADAVVKMQERGGLAPVKDSIASVGGVQFFLEALTRMLQDSLTESTVPLFERDSSAEDDAATDGSVSPFLDAVLLSGVAKAGEALSGLAAAALLLAGLAMLVDIEQPEPQGVELALAPVVVTLVNVLRAALIVSWTVRRHVTLSVSYTRPKDSTTADARPPGLSSATVNNAEAAGDLDPMEDLRWLDAGTAVVTVERSLTVAQLLVEDAVKDEALSLCRAALAGVSTGGMRPLNTSPFGESIRGGVALILARQLLGVRENDDDDDAEDYLTEPEVRRRDRLWGRGALWDGVVRVAATLAEREDGALAAAVKELLTLLPVSAASLYLRGKVLLRLGEVEKSKACFERAATGVLSRETSNLHYVVPAEILGASLVGYYQHVLTLFEEQRQYAVAAAFARLAHSCLAVEGNADEELKRRLQKTIFSNSLEALLFDEAFTALMALPDIEIQRLCLRRFITVACEYGKLEDLCVRYAFGHIQPDVEQILLFKVRNRQLLPIAPPKPAGERDPNVNFHHVLYSYYVQRGSYKNASTVMFDYARRLGAIDSSDVGGGSLSPVIAEQTRAYLAAINALHLVAPKSRWIIWRSTGRGITNPLKKKRKLSSMRTEESYGQDDGSGQNLPPPSTTSEVVELSDIQKEYALALSKLRLAEKYREYEVSGGLPEPSDAVALHIHDGDFDTALSLGLAFKTDLTVVFGLLAQRSVDLVVAESAEGATPLGTVIIEDMAGVRGPASVKAWRLVQMCLKMHDSGATGYAYRKAVVEKALERNRFLALPVWLTEFYKTKNPEDLMRVYLRFGLLEQCVKFTVQVIENRTNSFPSRGFRPVHSARWLPYTLIDQLRALLDQRIETYQETVASLEKQYEDGDEGVEADLEGAYGDLEFYRELHQDIEEAFADYLSKVEDETRFIAGEDAVADAAAAVAAAQRDAAASKKPGSKSATVAASTATAESVLAKVPANLAARLGGKVATAPPPPFGDGGGGGGSSGSGHGGSVPGSSSGSAFSAFSAANPAAGGGGAGRGTGPLPPQQQQMSGTTIFGATPSGFSFKPGSSTGAAGGGASAAASFNFLSGTGRPLAATTTAPPPAPAAASASSSSTSFFSGLSATAAAAAAAPAPAKPSSASSLSFGFGGGAANPSAASSTSASAPSSAPASSFPSFFGSSASPSTASSGGGLFSGLSGSGSAPPFPSFGGGFGGASSSSTSPPPASLTFGMGRGGKK